MDQWALNYNSSCISSGALAVVGTIGPTFRNISITLIFLWEKQQWLNEYSVNKKKIVIINQFQIINSIFLHKLPI